MTRAEKLKMLNDLFLDNDAMQEQINKLNSLFMPAPECGLYETMFALFDTAVSATEAAIGDSHKWVEWMIFENDCGRNGYEAGYSDAMRPIRTAEDILDIIEDNNANSEQ